MERGTDRSARTTSAHDAAGRQTLRIGPRGYRTTYTFDANDQLTGRRYPDGTRATFTFDSTGRYTYAYDARSQRSLSVTPASQRISYTYDALGQRSFMIAPTGGRFTYAYDAAQRITRVINPEGDRTSYSYDNAHRRTVKKLANDTRASFTYDNADRLTTLANIAHTSTYISRYDYQYDPTGNRTGVLEVDGSRVTWLYDATYQLTGENRTGTSAYRDTFTYDPNGNRLLKNANGTRTATTYDAANQIRYSTAAAGRTTYTFDSAGNQQLVLNPDLTRTTTTWDYENQPTLYHLADATRVTATYNADHQRTSKQSATATTKFVWDAQNYLAETDATDAVTVLYTNEPQLYGNLISHRQAATSAYYHFDALGSTRQLTNSSATTDTLLYTAWGETIAHSGTTPLPLAWIGELGYQYDATLNRHLLRRRDYQSHLGKFLSDDPLHFQAGDHNLSRYAANNPINYTDPSGLRSDARYLNCKTECQDECYSKYQSGSFWSSNRSLFRYMLCINECESECGRLHPTQDEGVGGAYCVQRCVDQTEAHYYSAAVSALSGTGYVVGQIPSRTLGIPFNNLTTGVTKSPNPTTLTALSTKINKTCPAIAQKM